MLEFKDLSYAPVIQNFNRVFLPEKTYAITGPSGSGKTTLLKLAAGLILPSQGEIFFHQLPLSEINLSAYRSKNGFLPQNPLSLGQTLKDNLLWPFFLKNTAAPIPSENDMRHALDLFFLNHPLEAPVQNFSAGEKQRMAMVRLWLLKPNQLIFLDEPASALDLPMALKTVQILMNRFTHQTLLIVTHTPALVEMCHDQVSCLKTPWAPMRKETS